MHVPFNSAILLLDVFPEKSCTSAQRGMYQRAHRGSVCDSEKLDMTYLQENEWKTMQYVSILEYYEADSYIPAMARSKKS